MDNLKKYLQQQAEAMDTDVPGADVWQRIQRSAAPAKQHAVIRIGWLYAAAAAVAIALAAGIFLLRDQAPVKPTDTVLNYPDAAVQSNVLSPATAEDSNKTKSIAVVPDAALSHQPLKKAVTKKAWSGKKKPLPVTDPALLIVADVEQNYARLANLQLARLRGTPVYGESADYFSLFKQSLKQIDKDEAVIKATIRLHGLTADLLQQLINISRQKLNVLMDLQTEITKLNTKVTQRETAPANASSYYLNL